MSRARVLIRESIAHKVFVAIPRSPRGESTPAAGRSQDRRGTTPRGRSKDRRGAIPDRQRAAIHDRYRGPYTYNLKLLASSAIEDRRRKSTGSAIADRERTSADPRSRIAGAYYMYVHMYVCMRVHDNIILRGGRSAVGQLGGGRSAVGRLERSGHLGGGLLVRAAAAQLLPALVHLALQLVSHHEARLLRKLRLGASEHGRGRRDSGRVGLVTHEALAKVADPAQ